MSSQPIAEVQHRLQPPLESECSSRVLELRVFFFRPTVRMDGSFSIKLAATCVELEILDFVGWTFALSLVYSSENPIFRDLERICSKGLMQKTAAKHTSSVGAEEGKMKVGASQDLSNEVAQNSSSEDKFRTREYVMEMTAHCAWRLSCYQDQDYLRPTEWFLLGRLTKEARAKPLPVDNNPNGCTVQLKALERDLIVEVPSEPESTATFKDKVIFGLGLNTSKAKILRTLITKETLPNKDDDGFFVLTCDRINL